MLNIRIQNGDFDDDDDDKYYYYYYYYNVVVVVVVVAKNVYSGEAARTTATG